MLKVVSSLLAKALACVTESLAKFGLGAWWFCLNRGQMPHSTDKECSVVSLPVFCSKTPGDALST